MEMHRVCVFVPQPMCSLLVAINSCERLRTEVFLQDTHYEDNEDQVQTNSSLRAHVFPSKSEKSLNIYIYIYPIIHRAWAKL